MMADLHGRDDKRFGEGSDKPAAEDSDSWEDIERRLEELRPDEPSPEALDRIWHSIDAEIGGAEVEPEIASRLQQLDAGEPAEDTLDRIWERVDKETDAEDADTPAPIIAFPAWRWAVAAAVILLLLVGPLRVAAADALPGSPLYPVKRAYEQVRLGIALTPAQRASVALSLAERRRSEAEQLVARGGSSERVKQLTSQALSYLSDYAAGTEEAASEQVQSWEQTIATWPDAYRSDAGAVLASWRDEHPDIAGSAAPTSTPTATRSATEPPALVPAQTNTPAPDVSATATRTPTPMATRTVVPTQTPRPLIEATPSVTIDLTPTLPQQDVTATVPQVLPTTTPTVPPVLPSATTVPSLVPSATATLAAASTIAPTETSTPKASSTPAPAPPTSTLPAVLPSETPTLPPVLPSETPTLPGLLPSVTPTLDALP